MISQTEKSPRRCRPLSESYEEKCERRHETRESLWRRNNVTTCRRVGQYRRKEAEEQPQSPRQKEFLKRRNLATEEGKRQRRFPAETPASLGQEHATGISKEASSWMDLRSPISLQLHSTAASHHQLLQHRPTDPHPQNNLLSCGISSENILPRYISRSSRGTQTLTDSRAIKKDSSQQTDCGIAVLDKEIIQLSNYLREALQRELLLKQKMVILQELLSTLLQASEKSWKGQLNEDKLKGKLRALENQLHACTQVNCKMNKCKRWRWRPRSLIYTDIGTGQKGKRKRRDRHRQALRLEQNQLKHKGPAFSRVINLLQNQSKEQKAQEEVVGRKDQVLTMQIQPPCPIRDKQGALLNHPEDEGEENLKDQIQRRTAQLIAKEKECAELHSELEALSDEYRSCMTKLRQCRDELKLFQSKQSNRQCGPWVPLLMVVVAAAAAAFLANFVP
ncbi:TRAF3-interacting JNK-activating modulator isoform X3 [Pelodiscus sinensis]|uniref:TRAF3-interacting JNK-activating modulator isoform X3 n=1 Tax=Pelodiscus sinensis TaxID=13735 RepID=UPI003F6B587D